MDRFVVCISLDETNKSKNYATKYLKLNCWYKILKETDDFYFIEIGVGSGDTFRKETKRFYKERFRECTELENHAVAIRKEIYNAQK